MKGSILCSTVRLSILVLCWSRFGINFPVWDIFDWRRTTLNPRGDFPLNFPFYFPGKVTEATGMEREKGDRERERERGGVSVWWKNTVPMELHRFAALTYYYQITIMSSPSRLCCGLRGPFCQTHADHSPTSPKRLRPKKTTEKIKIKV